MLQEGNLQPRGSLWACVLLGVVLTVGCGPAADDPLPSEDDLLAYSLAVAQKARLRLPDNWYIPVYHVGRVYQRFGLEDEALKWFRRAVDLEPNAPEPSREIGFILSQRKDRMADAISAYRQSLRGDPNQAGIRTRIALIDIHMSRFEDAVEELRAEIAAGGATDLTHYNLAIALQSLKRHEEALEQFDAAAGMQNALYGKYRSLLALGRQEQAKKTIEAFRHVKKKADAELIERDQQAEKSNSDAQRRYTGATWLDAATAYYEQSRRATDVAAQADNLSQAVDACRAALRFDDRLIEAWKFLVRYYGERSMHAECRETLQRGLAVFPEHALWHYRLALELLQPAPKAPDPLQPSPEVKASIRHLERAIELAPRLHQAHLLLARTILYFNRQPERLPAALEHAQLAFGFNSHRGPENYDVLAMALHYTGQHRAAWEMLRDGARMFPDQPRLAQRRDKYRRVFAETGP